MIRPFVPLRRLILWVIGGVSIAGLSAMAGCSNSGEGTVTVSAESGRDSSHMEDQTPRIKRGNLSTVSP